MNAPLLVRGKVAEIHRPNVRTADEPFILPWTALLVTTQHARAFVAEIDAYRLIRTLVGPAICNRAVSAGRARVANASLYTRAIPIRATLVANLWRACHAETEKRYTKSKFPTMTSHPFYFPKLKEP